MQSRQRNTKPLFPSESEWQKWKIINILQMRKDKVIIFVHSKIHK